MTRKLTVKKPRRPSLSLRVRRGFECIASNYTPQTEDEFAAVAWMRRTMAVLESRQRQPQDAGGRCSAQSRAGERGLGSSAGAK